MPRLRLISVLALCGWFVGVGGNDSGAAPVTTALADSATSVGRTPSAVGMERFRVAVPGAGFLSLGAYDGQGTLVRSLCYARDVVAGPSDVSWDLTTDLGLPAAPGEYRVKGVWFPAPPKAQYRMKVGISGEPPYPLANGLGGWGANLGAPTGVASAGDQVLAVFGCVEDNLNTGVQLMDGDGRVVRRFHTFFPWDIRLACAMDTRNAYVAVASLGEKRLVIGKYDLANPRGKILADVPTTGSTTPAGLWKGRWITDVRGLAVGSGRVFVSVTPDNRFLVLDADGGKLLQQLEFPAPRGVVVRRESVFLLSDRSLLQLDLDGKLVRVIVDRGLEEPSGLAMDAAGLFYVADGGSAQRVKVFDANGKPLRTVGVAGGRPREGRFNPQGMLEPRSLCVAPGGRLWVAEENEDFQRISVWGTADGKLAKEFFNTRISAGQGLLSPDLREMLFTNGVYADVPGVSAYKVDFAAGTWYPSWRLTLPVERTRQDEVFVGNKHIYGIQAKAYDGRVPYLGYTDGLVQADNGRMYAVGGEFSIWLFDPQTHQPKLAALVYEHRVNQLPDGRFEGCYDQGPHNWLTWSDLNGDGKMSRDECVFVPNLEPMKGVTRFFGRRLEKDLSVLFIGPDWVVRRLRPQKVLESGVPVYDWRTVETVATLPKPDFRGGDGWKKINYVYPQGIGQDDDCFSTFAESASGSPLKLGGIDGDGWWASRNWRRSPMLFDRATGAPRWLKLGRRAPALAKPGEMYFPVHLAGRVDGCVFVPSTIAQMYVWTDTGLYLGKLYLDPQEKGPESDQVRVELTGAYVYKVDGRIYACTGDHGVFVHEVTLPKLTAVDAGTVVVRAESAAAVKPWDPDGPVPAGKPVAVARSIYDWQKKTATRTITLDGRLDEAEWGGVTSLPITLNGQAVADVQVTFDAQNLYLAYRVQDAVGLRNSGQELPNCPFTSGAYVDFCLGPKWDTPQRREVADGDVRVILGRAGESGREAPLQMAFWPVRKELRRYDWPAGKKPESLLSPQTIRSPVAEQRFDDISPLSGVESAVQATPSGYTLEVQVPWAAVGKDLGSRVSVVGFDFSVAFANAGGTERLRAAHWAGESEGRVVDRPGSAELKPWTWGTLQLDRSPLPAVTPKAP